MDTEITIHGQEDFVRMREAGKILSNIFNSLFNQVIPGARTSDIEKFIENKVKGYGVESGTVGFKGYKYYSCISVNNTVCHGIPGNKIPTKGRTDDKLKSGDILYIDIVIKKDGWYSDSSRMYVAGNIKPMDLKLVRVAYDTMMAGIESIKPGVTLGEVGYNMNSVAIKNRMSTVKKYCGHGIGKQLHALPNVLSFGIPGEGEVLKEGMFLTIEPMVNYGKSGIRKLKDNWTVVTKDGSNSAQFEHTIGVTADGVEIFTE